METFDFTNNEPIENFLILFKEAEDHKVPDANAMTLATVDSNNCPSQRVVLYKSMHPKGFTFYTNYLGKKSLDIQNNKNVCLNFYWSQTHKQVRVQGEAEKLTRAESEAYFKTRPRVSQLGAWASSQSEEIPDFDFLQERFQKFEKEFENKEVPCPPHWGGFVVIPQLVEFWFARDGRMHERYLYKRQGSSWKKSFLSP
ncbi:MAG: pyridoxamine 5'-phosphate oxidase [Bdellovibrionales bacterium]|nr:pyridoxamine 5'-phosphate oxidase [Bdellovibrionales bacterium]